MLSRHAITRTCGMVLIAVALSATTAANADWDKGPDVDFEKLKAEIWRGAGEWRLTVDYDIEIEDIYRHDAFEFLFYLSEDGRTIREPGGQPLEFVVPLDRPSEVDDDEVEFEAELTVPLSDGLFRDPDDLRIHGIVVFAGDNRPLETKDKSVKYKRPKHHVRGVTGHVSVGTHGVGVGVSVGLSRPPLIRTTHVRHVQPVVTRHIVHTPRPAIVVPKKVVRIHSPVVTARKTVVTRHPVVHSPRAVVSYRPAITATRSVHTQRHAVHASSRSGHHRTVRATAIRTR